MHKRGTSVYVVSGGFRLVWIQFLERIAFILTYTCSPLIVSKMIEPVAEMLSVPNSHIFANTVFFNDDGTYLRFDPNEPTSRDGGKPAVMEM